MSADEFEREKRVVPPLCRRDFLLTTAATAMAMTGSCGRGTPHSAPAGGDAPSSPARLSARPSTRSTPPTPTAPGLRTLRTGPGERTALLNVPPGLADSEPATLVLALHGAGGDARAGLTPLLPFVDANRLLLLATSAHGATWDAVQGRWGPDVRQVDLALMEVLAGFRIDLTRLVVSGFSDGASYALSLGLANADLFTHVIAFSPGFIPAGPRVGKPAVYVSHGRHDDVLPIDSTTRRIVPRLRASGYPVGSTSTTDRTRYQGSSRRTLCGGYWTPLDAAAH